MQDVKDASNIVAKSVVYYFFSKMLLMKHFQLANR